MSGVNLPLSLLRLSADGPRPRIASRAAIQENRESRSDSESCPSYLGFIDLSWREAARSTLTARARAATAAPFLAQSKVHPLGRFFYFGANSPSVPLSQSNAGAARLEWVFDYKQT